MHELKPTFRVFDSRQWPYSVNDVIFLEDIASDLLKICIGIRCPGISRSPGSSKLGQMHFSLSTSFERVAGASCLSSAPFVLLFFLPMRL